MRARSLLLAALVAVACGFLPGGASAQGNPDFRLNNRLSQPIMEVNVSSSGQAAWGQDLMGSNVLPAGGVLTLSGPASATTTSSSSWRMARCWSGCS